MKGKAGGWVREEDEGLSALGLIEGSRERRERGFTE